MQLTETDTIRRQRTRMQDSDRPVEGPPDPPKPLATTTIATIHLGLRQQQQEHQHLLRDLKTLATRSLMSHRCMIIGRVLSILSILLLRCSSGCRRLWLTTLCLECIISRRESIQLLIINNTSSCSMKEMDLWERQQEAVVIVANGFPLPQQRTIACC